MGKQWKQCQTLFFWAPKSLQELDMTYVYVATEQQQPIMSAQERESSQLSSSMQINKTC